MQIKNPAAARARAGAMLAYRDGNYAPKVLEDLRGRAARLVAAIEAKRAAARAPRQIADWAEAEADVKRMLAHLI